MRAPAVGGEQDGEDGSRPGPRAELLPVPRAAYLPQVAPRGTVARIENAADTEDTEASADTEDAGNAEPAPDSPEPAAVGGGRRVRPAGLLLGAGGAAAVIAGLIVTAGLLTGGSESDDAGRHPGGVSAAPSGGGEADGGPLGGDDEGGAPVDGGGAQPDDRAGRDRGGDGDASADGRGTADDGRAADAEPGRANGQIGSIAPTAPPADGTQHPPSSSAPTDDSPLPTGPPVLRPGDSGAEVTELQHRLRQVGLGLLQAADGAYDDGVRASVRTFQSVNGLEEDERGVYGPETRRELESRTDEP
ncbi:peptidoglycan-binding protein [Streptomyces sp. WMMC500]|uniref:peptidoglycan-binding protein n=1 Tax=Streptomyces sp. WMMC500 TaxID=3015154 RepID=UPI00248B346B|nr:peptidoglycan-binding protein [Streptomyces sp. WMMC500]WBB61621.1 peptidoglycan-binding protein [Streptomyces sp. WMMC500]